MGGFQILTDRIDTVQVKLSALISPYVLLISSSGQSEGNYSYIGVTVLIWDDLSYMNSVASLSPVSLIFRPPCQLTGLRFISIGPSLGVTSLDCSLRCGNVCTPYVSFFLSWTTPEASYLGFWNLKLFFPLGCIMRGAKWPLVSYIRRGGCIDTLQVPCADECFLGERAHASMLHDITAAMACHCDRSSYCVTSSSYRFALHSLQSLSGHIGTTFTRR